MVLYIYDQTICDFSFKRKPETKHITIQKKMFFFKKQSR